VWGGKTGKGETAWKKWPPYQRFPPLELQKRGLVIWRVERGEGTFKKGGGEKRGGSKKRVTPDADSASKLKRRTPWLNIFTHLLEGAKKGK